jgi:hypothetical protein
MYNIKNAVDGVVRFIARKRALHKQHSVALAIPDPQTTK